MDAEESKATAAADKSPDIDIEEIDFDLSSFSMDAEESKAAADKSPSIDIEEIDFDLSSFSMDAGETKESIAGKTPSIDIEEVDFDLGSFSMNTKVSDAAEKDSAIFGALSETQLTDKQQDIESFEFNLSSDDVKSETIEDFGFNVLENSENADSPAFSLDKALDFNEDFDDDFDFNFDLDEPLSRSGQSSQYDEFGVSDLTDMDELETKLDLAKAYVDMGDADAAKDIAQEVLEQGNDEQKKAAQALLDELK
ncbi:FimV/HubP family polar landmark protein [Candidatus Methylobacter oryzae]|uniref:FimV/HubP family polar landmark protein n=1 Tax=Candidatus Methylobacter oryzae TaxID=2497749 RepID=UPI001F4FEF0B|nr:FimV/HubP family polar landmark protein [Candidatus Methylobacter oryzae]